MSTIPFIPRCNGSGGNLVGLPCNVALFQMPSLTNISMSSLNMSVPVGYNCVANRGGQLARVMFAGIWDEYVTVIYRCCFLGIRWANFSSVMAKCLIIFFDQNGRWKPSALH